MALQLLWWVLANLVMLDGKEIEPDVFFVPSNFQRNSLSVQKTTIPNFQPPARLALSQAEDLNTRARHERFGVPQLPRLLSPRTDMDPPGDLPLPPHAVGLDTATVTFTLNTTQLLVLKLYFTSDECHDCVPTWVATVLKGVPSTLSLDSKFGKTISFSRYNETWTRPLAKFHDHWGENGKYSVLIQDAKGASPLKFTFRTIKDGDDSLKPLRLTIIVLVAAMTAWQLVLFVYRCEMRRRMRARGEEATEREMRFIQPLLPSEEEDVQVSTPFDALNEMMTGTGGGLHKGGDYSEPSGAYSMQADSAAAAAAQAANEKALRPKRVRALDIFRGVSVLWYIFIVYGGGGYWFFYPSAWNGLTLGDLLPPWFLWIMGFAVAMSYDHMVTVRHFTRLQLMLKVARRCFLLMLLGMIAVNWLMPLDYVRVPGTLQRIGVCYLVLSLMLVFIPRSSSPACRKCCGGSNKYDDPHASVLSLSFDEHSNAERAKETERDRGGACTDIVDHAAHWCVVIAVAAAHACLIYLMTVPGCPRGYVGPGGIGDYGKYFNCTGGVTNYLEQQMFSKKRVYMFPYVQWTYLGGPFDHEGLISCMNGLLVTYIGAQAAWIYLYHASHWARIARWTAWMLACAAIAFGLNGPTQNDGVIPFNRQLFSLSYCLIQSATAYLAFLVCYALSDQFKLWTGGPFVYAGMNGITIYLGGVGLQTFFPFNYLPKDINDYSHAFLMTQHCVAVALWAMIAWLLFRHRMFMKIS